MGRSNDRKKIQTSRCPMAAKLNPMVSFRLCMNKWHYRISIACKIISGLNKEQPELFIQVKAFRVTWTPIFKSELSSINVARADMVLLSCWWWICRSRTATRQANSTCCKSIKVVANLDTADVTFRNYTSKSLTSINEKLFREIMSQVIAPDCLE